MKATMWLSYILHEHYTLQFMPNLVYKLWQSFVEYFFIMLDTLITGISVKLNLFYSTVIIKLMFQCGFVEKLQQKKTTNCVKYKLSTSFLLNLFKNN